MNLLKSAVLLFAAPLLAAVPSIAYAQSQPTLLVDVDHRASISLDGDWHFILDPYSNGMSRNSAGEIGSHGFFEDRELPPGSNGLIEYDFAKSPTLKVPGDWNTQSAALLNYEGLLWYQRDFEFSPAPNCRVFFHVGAANYRANLFVNGKHICDHEGGFTPFDCGSTVSVVRFTPADSSFAASRAQRVPSIKST